MTSMGKAVRTKRRTYDLSAVVDDRLSALPAGSNLLIAGPSMMGKETLACTAFTAQHQHEQPTVFVTMDLSAEKLLEQVTDRDVSTAPEDIYVVDCTGQSDRGTFDESTNIKYVNSPGDLTGIGIGLAKCIRDIGDGARNGLGLGLLSLSTLLQYASADRVFNFTHVVTGRVAAADYLSVWTLDTASHDEQTVNTIRGQFDYILELRESNSGERELRILGGNKDWRTWKPITRGSN